ncbi:MAG: lipoate--protein ligase family protein [Anaerolineaceae bacterium]|nr:lipoate--protein ligase family protein [Anaerolineaceae bacterium]
MNNIWRLIINKPKQASWNMAMDEMLLEEMQNENYYPVLRLFSWEPASLSLGYAQPISDIDFDALEKNGWGLVRRPTGGRGILHTDELTYSVIAPIKNKIVAGNIMESYRRLSQALLLALSYLGIRASADKIHDLPNNSKKNGAVCFEVPSNYEITYDGKKLIGSAQARKKNGVLQHGTLPLQGDLTRIVQVLQFSDKSKKDIACQRILQRATTIENILGKTISWEMAAEAFTKAFKNTFDITFINHQLTQEEADRTQQLVEAKFGNDQWTNRL